MSNIQESIQETIDNNPVVLYMKGSADFPQCGFSSQIVEILRRCQTVFKDFNILESDELRQGIKDFSDWPTIPQLYVRGEFIGGCDIVTDLYEKGELQGLLADDDD